MPVSEQAFTSKKRTWEKFLLRNDAASEVLDDIFSDPSLQGSSGDSVEVSRGDLFRLASMADRAKFIIAVILWGYPSGMRGNLFHHITSNLEMLISVLESSASVKDWGEHYNLVSQIHGVGLSTYSKLLYFFGSSIESRPALILDKRIIETINKGVFFEFSELGKIRYTNAVKKYPDYLRFMDLLATGLSVQHGGLEMFLFEFGLNIKRPVFTSDTR